MRKQIIILAIVTAAAFSGCKKEIPILIIYHSGAYTQDSTFFYCNMPDADTITWYLDWHRYYTPTLGIVFDEPETGEVSLRVVKNGVSYTAVSTFEILENPNIDPTVDGFTGNYMGTRYGYSWTGLGGSNRDTTYNVILSLSRKGYHNIEVNNIEFKYHHEDDQKVYFIYESGYSQNYGNMNITKGTKEVYYYRYSGGLGGGGSTTFIGVKQ